MAVYRLYIDDGGHPSDQLLTFVEEGAKHFGDMEKVLKRDGIPAPQKVPKALSQVQPAERGKARHLDS